jgi:hypothetical protein
MRRAKRSSPGAAPILVAAILIFWASPLIADEGGSAPTIDKDSVLLLQTAILPGALAKGSDDSLASYSSALLSSLARGLREAGFTVKLGEGTVRPGVSENEAGSAMAASAGCGWAAYSVLSLNGYRLSYRISFYESESGGLAAADSFTAVAGLGVFALIDESTARVAARAKEAKKGLAAPRRAVGYRVRIASSDEGASVSMDNSVGTDAFPLGTIAGGELELPYFPFLIGDKLSLTLSAPSRRAQRVEIVLGEEAPILRAPALPLSVRAAFYASAQQWERLLGAGGGYRLYLERDWSYFFAEDQIFADVDFQSGAIPFVHDELWSGFGWYLILPPESRLRFGLQVGVGYLSTLATSGGAAQVFFSDLALRPADFYAEWELNSAHAIRLGLSSSYSLGTGSAGLLGRGWVFAGIPAISLAWMWER